MSVNPRSSKNAIACEGNVLKIWVTAPAVDGAANEALLKLLSARLEIPRRFLQIVQGTTGRQKVVEIAGLTIEELRKKLS